MAEQTIQTQSPVQTQEPASPAVTEAAPLTATQPAPQGSTVSQSTQPVVSDRTTEQFEKLKESNKKLFEANRLLQEELAKRAKSEQTFAPIQQPSQTTPAPSIDQFVTEDPVTGERYVDQEKLITALQSADTKAARAQAAVENYIRQQQVLDEERQTREAYDSHPEVNPNSEKFDVTVSKRTRSLLLDSMMNPQDYGGHALSFKEAAEEAKKQSPDQAKVLESKTQQAQQAVEGKAQATAEATGVSSTIAQQVSGGGSEELDTLRNKTRLGRGDEQTWAVAQRLAKVTHTGTPTSST